MTERYRICTNCEYFQEVSNDHISGDGDCRYNITGLSIDNIREYAQVYKFDLCHNWEPIWDGNEHIKAEFDKFRTLHILSSKYD